MGMPNANSIAHRRISIPEMRMLFTILFNRISVMGVLRRQYNWIFADINSFSAERQKIFYKGVERGCVGTERRSISIAAITNWTPSKTDNVGSITVPVGAGIPRIA